MLIQLTKVYSVKPKNTYSAKKTNIQLTKVYSAKQGVGKLFGHGAILNANKIQRAG